MSQSSLAESGTVLVSVIIPVFKVSEQLLTRCLLSVRNQTHAALEILVVDDGSPEPIDAWVAAAALGDARVRVIHQDNRGVSDARNAGLDRASGEFVCFVDADDLVLPEFVSRALALALGIGADAVFGGIELRHSSGSTYWRSTGDASWDSPHVADSVGLVRIRANSLSVSPSPFEPTPATCLTNTHAALFAEGLMKQSRFRVGVAHAEDRIFLVEALGHARSAAFCTDTWYVYDLTEPVSATRSMPSSAAVGLGQTVRAMADVGGFVPGTAEGVPEPIRRAAAIGVLNYLKVITGLLGALLPGRGAVTEMRNIMSAAGVPQAIAAAEPGSPQDSLFLWCARRRQVAPLLALGGVWTLLGARPRGASGSRNG